MLEFFLADRRPLEWNQWPEITWRDPRAPGHLGDVPHTWIAAEYMLALISMVASEREEPEKLVLASGLPWHWISHGGWLLRARPDDPLRQAGLSNFRERNRNASVHQSAEALSLPPGGLHVAPPLPPGKRIRDAVCQEEICWKSKTSGTFGRRKRLPVAATLFLGDAEGPVLA